MTKEKTLYIVRHAKSTWDYPNVADIDRPLNERGIKNAYQMSNRLKMLNIKPQKIYCSTAVRAMQTANVFLRVLEIPFTQIEFKPEIYHADYYKMLELLREEDEGEDIRMYFGHNPTFTDFANTFCKTYIDNMPTAAIVTLKFKAEKWSEVGKKNLIFEDFDYPKKTV